MCKQTRRSLLNLSANYWVSLMFSKRSVKIGSQDPQNDSLEGVRFNGIWHVWQNKIQICNSLELCSRVSNCDVRQLMHAVRATRAKHVGPLPQFEKTRDKMSRLHQRYSPKRKRNTLTAQLPGCLFDFIADRLWGGRTFLVSGNFFREYLFELSSLGVQKEDDVGTSSACRQVHQVWGGSFPLSLSFVIFKSYCYFRFRCK